MIGLLALLGFAIWSRRLAGVARAPAARPAALGRVSIIVPARDEAGNLPALLASLARLDPAPHQVIVVDDHSSDGTGDLARAAGATVVVPPPLPPGWLGKPWACAAGAAVATGDRLLFTDADTVHAPDSLDRLPDAELVSVVPTHRAERPWEKLQGVFQLLLLVATPRFVIGQYLLFRREAYERLGGHAAVRGRVAEDLAFARRCGRVESLFAPGLLGVRMYPEGLGAFLRGWRRNFREGVRAAGVVRSLEMVAVIAWLLGVPLAALAGDPWALPLLALTVAEIARRQGMVGRLPWWGALAYPLLVTAFVLVTALAMADELRGAPVVWRRRSIKLDVD